MFVGDECLFDHHIVAAGAPHAQCVPSLFNHRDRPGNDHHAGYGGALRVKNRTAIANDVAVQDQPIGVV